MADPGGVTGLALSGPALLVAFGFGGWSVASASPAGLAACGGYTRRTADPRRSIATERGVDVLDRAGARLDRQNHAAALSSRPASRWTPNIPRYYEW